MMKLVLMGILVLVASCTKKHEKNPETLEHVKAQTLTLQLAEKAQQSAQKAPAETRQTMFKAIQDLKQSEIMKTALKEGDQIPAFALPDMRKGEVRSEELLKKGPLIVTFYRGGWCPYCNLQLRDLQKHIGEIKSTGAELVAISPETPDSTSKTIKDNEIDFYVLSDADGKVGEKFGLMFKITEELKKVYQDFGINLEKANGNGKWELPLSATYIVNQDGKIVYSFVDADYRKRAETLDLIKILQDLKKN